MSKARQNYARNFKFGTHAYVVSVNILFSTKVLLILLMSEFFFKKSAFLAKIVALLKAIVWELC